MLSTGCRRGEEGKDPSDASELCLYLSPSPPLEILGGCLSLGVSVRFENVTQVIQAHKSASLAENRSLHLHPLLLLQTPQGTLGTPLARLASGVR